MRGVAITMWNAKCKGVETTDKSIACQIGEEYVAVVRARILKCVVTTI